MDIEDIEELNGASAKARLAVWYDAEDNGWTWRDGPMLKYSHASDTEALFNAWALGRLHSGRPLTRARAAFKAVACTAEDSPARIRAAAAADSLMNQWLIKNSVSGCPPQ